MLHKNIYSYRESISTEDALHNLIHKIEKALANNDTVIVLFLDMDAAFSSANVSGILKNLNEIGAEKEIIKWSKFMLENRKAIAFFGDEQVEKDTDRGTPQGYILSTDFWNILSNNMQFRFPKNHSSERDNFADDGVNITIGKCSITMANNIQNDIKIFLSWAKEHGLKFNSSKTKLMMFTRKRNPKLPRIYMNNEEIEWVNEFKYLGLTLDNKLTWNAHISNTVKKANAVMNICRKMIGKTWGLNPKSCKWTYTAIVRPIISYGCLIWMKAVNQTSKIAKLEQIQRKACLATLRTMTSTPTATMEILLNLKPLKTHLQTIALTSYDRLIRNGNWKPIVGETINKNGHSYIINMLATQVKDLNIPTDSMINRVTIQTNFHTLIEDRQEIRTRSKRMIPEADNMIYCYTDGSKSGTNSGCAYTIRGSNTEEQGHRTLSTYTTVFQAEMTAIHEAVSKLLELRTENKDIKIYIDSQAAILALNSLQINNKLVLESKKLLNQLNNLN